MGLFNFNKKDKADSSKKSAEGHAKSIWGEFQGKEIIGTLELGGVHHYTYEEEHIKVGSEVTVRTDEAKDTFEFICEGVKVGEIRNTTYEELKRRAYYLRLLREGKHMVVTDIQDSMYGPAYTLYVGIVE